MRILKIIGGSIAAMLIIIISQFVSQIIAGIVGYVMQNRTHDNRPAKELTLPYNKKEE